MYLKTLYDMAPDPVQCMQSGLVVSVIITTIPILWPQKYIF